MIEISDSLYLGVHTAVGWFFTLGSALLLFPAIRFLQSGSSPMSVDAVGHYFVAFAGVLNLVWGLALLATNESAQTGRLMAWPTCAGFVLLSLFRIPFSRNEVILAELGKAPRYEVIVFAIAAAFFGVSAL